MAKRDGNALAELGIKQESGFGRFFRRLLVFSMLAAAGMGGYYYLQRAEQPAAVRYATDEAALGKIEVMVSATGNLEPKDKVEVSSEQSGRVAEVLVDFNDRVIVGQVLARLDTHKLEAEVLVRRNSLVSSRAVVSQAQAALRENQLSLERIKRLFELSGGRTPSQLDVDAAEVALIKAKADLTSAEAAVAVAEANLEASETDLAKARIVAPIDGVVLRRQVEPGQTVAASLSAPTLFVLARDLVDMELHVDIDEADIGRVRVGQRAVFTVDAYPRRRFEAQITQIRLMSSSDDTSSSNVVSYETVLAVRNDDLALLPGMTAIAEIAVARAEGVLTIANAALRFEPVTTAGERQAGSGNQRSLVSLLLPRRPRGNRTEKRSSTGRAVEGGTATVWVLRNGQPVAVEIVLGLSDGLRTEVKSGELEAGEQVITDTMQTTDR